MDVTMPKLRKKKANQSFLKIYYLKDKGNYITAPAVIQKSKSYKQDY